MVHILGAKTASEMWKQLTLVKENRGKMGILMARKALYRYSGEEGVSVVDHIAKLREMQEELHLMGSLVSDEDFVDIILMSLPESWEGFLTSFMGSRTDDAKTVSSHQLVALLLDEERRRTKRTGGSQDVVMVARGNEKKNLSNSDKECYNCKKKGHISRDCWSKGGGKEGQGPTSKKKGKGKQEKTNQATENINDALDIAYMATISVVPEDGQSWILDSGTSVHISNDRRTFAEYHALTNLTVKGIGKLPAKALGRGTMTIDFKVEGKTIQHRVKDVLYVPEAPNCLVSVSRFEEAGGSVVFKNGKCFLLTKDNRLVGRGTRRGRLYYLDAHAVIAQEYANVAKVGRSWNDWHRRYGHVSISNLEIIARKQLVDGFDVDTTTAATSCDACIQAKQTVKLFPQEAEGRSKIPGERVFSDVWGKSRTQSIGGAYYFISFIDNATRMVVVMFMKAKSDATDCIKQFVNEIE